MNKKVEELVEWVANEFWAELNPDRTCTLSQLYRKEGNLYYSAARKVLSHPDLALIDNELPHTGKFLRYVIPLAEALKESEVSHVQT